MDRSRNLHGFIGLGQRAPITRQAGGGQQHATPPEVLLDQEGRALGAGKTREHPRRVVARGGGRLVDRDGFEKERLGKEIAPLLVGVARQLEAGMLGEAVGRESQGVERARCLARSVAQRSRQR